MRRYLFLSLVGSAVFVSFSFGQVPGNQLFDNARIHQIKIVSLFENLADTLTSNYMLSFGMNQFQLRDIPYAPSKLIIDGTVLDTLGIRYKGFNSWWHSVKKPIKIDVNRYKTGQEYDGLKKFNLHNGSGDPSFIRENIDYKILRSLGIKAPRTSYAQVYMDTVYLGLYRVVEQVDNTFLDVNFGNHTGNLYVQEAQGTAGFNMRWEGSGQEAYYESISLENHRNRNDWSGLIHFLDVLNNTSDIEFRDSISSVFEVDEFLQILAFDLAVNNLDYYGNSGRNYYLYDEGGKIHWIPWDYNLTWQDGKYPVNIDPKDYPVLIRRILQVPDFYDVFMRKYCQLKTIFSKSNIDQLVAGEAVVIGPYLQNDPQMDYPYEAFLRNLDSTWIRIPGLKRFAAGRYDDISTTLDELNIDCNTAVEISSGEQKHLQLYPVPARDWLNIGHFPGHEFRVSVLDLYGREVMNAVLFEKGRMNVARLSGGCYVLRVTDGERVYSELLFVNR
jgi:hypothetical protein